MTRWLLLPLLALVLADPITHDPHAGPHARRPNRFPGEPGPYPSDWFFAQRAYPRGEIPLERWERAVEQARVERAALGTQSAASLTWQEIGPYNVGGRVTAIAAPAGGNPVYVGAAAGGVFKSTDGGASFTPVFDAVGVYSIGAIAVHPTDPGVVYVGTGESNSSIDSYPGMGVFKSTDGGATWSPSGLTASRHIGRIALDPRYPQRVFVAAMGNLYTPGGERGLYRSEDGGDTWERVLFVNDSTGVVDVVVNPAHPETIYAASWERRRTAFYRRVWGPGCGIWRSVDWGDTWTRLTNGLPTTSRVGRIALDISPARPTAVNAQIMDSTGAGLGFYRSDNGGDTWSRRDVSNFTNSFGGFGWYFGTMAAHPANANTLWALGVNLRRSLDGGVSWSTVTGGMHVDFHDIWVDPSDPQRMYAGTDGGFYFSTNGGAGWTHSLDLPITQFYAGDVDQNDVTRVIGGTQDNSTPMRRLGDWDVLLFGDGFYSLIDPANPDIIFAEYQNGSGGQGPYKSVDGGNNFALAGSGFDFNDRYNWSTPFGFAPGNSQMLVLGSQRVYRSLNGGFTWTPISSDLTGGPYTGPGKLVYGTITTLAVAASSNDYIYAGTDDGRVWVTPNGGGIWNDISAGLPGRWVTRVAVDPHDARVVYATVSGFREDLGTAHVFRSPDAGGSWSDISGDLPDAPVNDIVVDPIDGSRLYVATDLGVYATVNLGAAWFALGAGLPAQTVYDIALQQDANTLIAFTHGRSAWKLDLSGLQVAVRPPGPGGTIGLGVSPNPSRGPVTLAVELGAPARASLGIFDPMGRQVADLGERPLPAGSHRIAWDGRGSAGRALPAGVYYARVATAAGVIVKPIQRLR